MSFGFSIGDGIVLSQLAWRTVEGARKACGEHDELTREVTSLHHVLQRVSDEISNPESPVNRVDANDKRRAELGGHVESCGRVLKVIDSVLAKYNDLGDDKRSGKKLWQKIKFGNGEMKDMANMRLKISTHTTAITMSLNLFMLGSQGRAESRLESQGGDLRGIRESVDWICAKMAASPEDSVMTTYTNDDKRFWRGLRHDLIKKGYSSSTLQKHKVLLIDYIAELDQRGVYDFCPDVTSGAQRPVGEKDIISTSQRPKAGLEIPEPQYLPRSTSIPYIPQERVEPVSQKTPILESDSKIDSELTQGIANDRAWRSTYCTVQMEEVLDEEFAPGAHTNVTLADDAIFEPQDINLRASVAQNNSHIDKSHHDTQSNLASSFSVQLDRSVAPTQKAGQYTTSKTRRSDQGKPQISVAAGPYLYLGENGFVPSQGLRLEHIAKASNQATAHQAGIGPAPSPKTDVWIRMARLEKEIKEQQRLAAKHRIREEQEANAMAEADTLRKAEKARKELAEIEAQAAIAIAMEVAAKENRAKENICVFPMPKNQQPIKFKDAIGRKFSFPFHLVSTWQGIEELIKVSFEHIPLEQLRAHIFDGHYDLVGGPDGVIILPQHWETLIEPNWEVSMHMWPEVERIHNSSRSAKTNSIAETNKLGSAKLGKRNTKRTSA